MFLKRRHFRHLGNNTRTHIHVLEATRLVPLDRKRCTNTCTNNVPADDGLHSLRIPGTGTSTRLLLVYLQYLILIIQVKINYAGSD